MREVTTSALRRKYSQMVLTFRIRFVYSLVSGDGLRDAQVEILFFPFPKGKLGGRGRLEGDTPITKAVEQIKYIPI